MARYICPSCGKPFHGRKCRECRYEVFDEEIGHRLHTHRGEPLVVRSPQQRPRARRDPFEWDKKTRKRKKKAGSVFWLVLLIVLSPMLELGELVIERGAELVSSMVSRGSEEPRPEPELSPGAEVIWEEGDYTLWADWSGGLEQGASVKVFLENRSSREVTVSSRHIVADGFLSEGSLLYCDARAGTRGAGTLNLTGRDLAAGGITGIHRLTLWLAVYDSETYETILETGPVVLEDGLPAEAAPPEPMGRLLTEGEGWQLRYVGYEADAYDPEAFSEGVLWLYLENNTGGDMTFYTEEASLNGEPAAITLWCELPAHTRTVTRVYLYGAADSGVDRLEQAEALWMKVTVLSGADDGLRQGEFTISDW